MYLCWFFRIRLHFEDLVHYFCVSNLSQLTVLVIFFTLWLTLCLSLNNKISFEKIGANSLSIVFFIFISVFFFYYLFRMWAHATLQFEYFLENNFSQNYVQYFGDTLVLLVLFITMFSWIFLSERFLFKNRFLVVFLMVFFFCTVNLVSTAHLLTMFIFFEFIFFPSIFFAYSLSYSKKSEKTIEYLVTWTLAGAMVAFAGFGLLFYTSGTVNLYTLSSFQFTSTELNSIFLLLFLGFGIKIPLWPFYYWLTKVHVEAPTGFSMFLSGFLVKTAFFCLSQIFFFLATKHTANLAVALILWGICDASSRMWSLLDIKRLIALATVQEMNMIVLFLFLLSNSNYSILNSFLLIHGLLSVFFFFLVDVVYKQTQTRNLTVLGGLSLSSPTTLFFVWIAILVYRGFPVFSKFFVEWELAGVMIQNFLGFGFVIVLFFSMLGSGSFFKHWTSVSYSSPEFINYTNFLSFKDFLIGSVCISSLFALNFLFFLF